MSLRTSPLAALLQRRFRSFLSAIWVAVEGTTSERDYPVSVLLGLVALAVLAPFVILGGVALDAYVAREKHSELHRLAGTADGLVMALDRELAAYIEVVRVLAGSSQLAGGDLTGFDLSARAAAAISGGDFILIGPDGQQLVNTFVPRGTVLPRAVNQAGVRHTFATGKTVIGDLRPGSVLNEHRFAVRVPVYVNDRIRYALTYLPRKRSIQGVVEQTFKPGTWFANVVDGRGMITARSAEFDRFFGAPASAAFLKKLSGQKGMAEGEDLNGIPSTAAYRRSQLADWHVIVWAPTAVINAPSRQALWLLASIILLALAASLGIGYFAVRLVARPTLRLVHAARALTARQPFTYSPSLMREANIVGEALAGAAADIGHVLQELSHRTKNILAVVQALARQTARHATDNQDFQDKFQQRLMGLARSHDLLVAKQWRGVCLVDLVGGHLRGFADGVSDDIIISGPPVLLTSSCAQNLGMALHELATNASKYGALSVPTGRVEVNWAWQEAGDGQKMLRLCWREQGGPAVTAPRRKGFGHVVIQDLIATSVNGEVSLDWRPEGLVWTLLMSASCAEK